MVEMCAFRDSMAAFNDLDARVYGVSVDLTFAQNVWIQQEGLNFPMLSDWDHEVIRRYDVVRDDLYRLIEAAKRSIFVVDDGGVVRYRWAAGGADHDYDELVPETKAAVADATSG